MSSASSVQDDAFGRRIAIVGIGCRFAGAPDVHGYWSLCLSGQDAFGRVPRDRWDADIFVDSNRRATDKSYTAIGAFIEDVRSFPALTLGIPPRRVEVMDPQQRASIEVALQALQDAGHKVGDMPRRTGVFMGVTASEWRVLSAARVVISQMLLNGEFGEPPQDVDGVLRGFQNLAPPRPFTAPGVLSNMIAASVAQELDLHGPAYTVDSACASAMMAVSDAVHQLRAGAIDAAIAGGVYLCLTPEHHVAFSRIGAMSPTGQCLPFDERADGFVQGDGAGAVVLKRLEDVDLERERVYAVIDGIATNNDGGDGDGPMAPVQGGQSEVIRAAWKDADVDPTRLGYVETHGTGTQVGDITEFNGLMSTVGPSLERAYLGSSKANVGHTMSAAGIAGLIRAALAIHHQTVPPMANFASPKPDLGLDDSPFEVPTTPVSWPGDRVAAVSSFGFGGTNAHAVLSSIEPPAASPEQPELVCISAPTEAELRFLAGSTAAALAHEPNATVAGVAHAWSARLALPWRLTVVATTVDELVSKLHQVAAGERADGVRIGEAQPGVPKLAFLYPGQGAQRTGMLADIGARFPVVSETLDALEGALSDDLPVPLTHLLYPERRSDDVSDEAATALLTQTEHCQPALLACGIALTRLLDSVGVKPTVVAGHSLGEFTAAAAAGVLSADDAARFVARRGQAMASLPGDHGAMAAVMADAETAATVLVDDAIIANFNHPRQVVVSGTTAAIEQVLAKAEANGVKAKPLVVSHGFHSPALAGLDVASLVDDLAVSDPAVPVASGIVDHPYRDAAEAREVFSKHAVSPVQFVGALEQCRALGADLYLQVGAGGPLASFARGGLPRDHRGVLNLASTDDHDGGTSLLEALGELWIRGVQLDLTAIRATAAPVSVPPSILPREPYWIIKDEPQIALKWNGKAPEQRAVSKQTTEPVAAEAPAPEPQADDIASQVIAVVAKVSAYPKASLQASMALIEDLGFDSLMVGDLATGLAEAFPGLGGIPQELLINRPTVQDLIDYVGSAGTSDTEVDDDAPLGAWQPVWQPAPASLTVGTVGRVHIGGVTDAIDGSALKAAVLAHGGTVVGADEAADLVLFLADDEPISVSSVLAGERPWPDHAGTLIALLDRQAGLGARPNVVVVRRDGDVWAEALAGVARCIAREWPGAFGKTVTIDRPDAELLLAEATSTDHSPDVRWQDGAREVLGLEQIAGLQAITIGSPEDTVLITGGTRGIGAKLAARLAERGARVVLVGRGDPSSEAQALIEQSEGRVVHAAADVTDRAALLAAVTPHQPITAVIHAAGVLADGPIGEVDADRGALARSIKAAGLLNAMIAAGSELRAVLAIGSWAGRFGNRHQAHYAAGNALMSGLSTALDVRTAVAEMGPWTSSEMVSSIPAAIQAAMRSEGVDFVGDEAGLNALWNDLQNAGGPVVHGRDLPHTTRASRHVHTLDVAHHPYLLDHAIEGTPVLPLAAAADLLAHAAAIEPPFVIDDLRLFQGIPVTEPTRVVAVARGDRVELRVGDRETLAYRARIRPLGPFDAPEPLSGGEAPSLPLADFYNGITFHGPLLQGLQTIDGVSDTFVIGTTRVGRPAEWIPGTDRTAWSVDPLALDSAMQLSGYIAWTQFQRAGTPVGIGRYLQVRAWPAGPLTAEVTWDGEQDGDRFVGTIVLRDADGIVAIAEDTVAEMRKVAAEDAPLEIKREWVDPSTWEEVKEMATRLQMAELGGIRNPFFAVHDGTARNTTSIGGKEFVNYSSYNYIGLSGDERVLNATKQAVDQYGTSVSASRVASGERPFHQELEAELAAAQGVEDSLVFTAGHATNVTTIGHLFGPDDIIFHDELIHDSALQGIKLSGSSRRAFRHDDPDHLEEQLRSLRTHYNRCLVVVEGVYSMDGDVCNLPAFIALKKKYGALLMVDEAHSFGVIGKTGCGVGEHYGIDGSDVDLWMGTLSKSLASCGGWIAGSKALIGYLRYTAPGFVYSAGITPANGVAALTSLRLMLEETWRVDKLQANAKIFHDELIRHGIDTGPARGASGVIPAVTGNSMHALMLSQRLVDQGINVQPIVYPAVADDAARLRFFLSSTHTEEQLVWTAERVAATLAGVREEFKLGA